MNLIKMTIVRIYITEGSKLLKILLNYLKEDAKVRGVSVFRAISGYGESGTHSAFLTDLSFDLPLIIEFFDEAQKVQAALEFISSKVKSEHIIFWEAKSNAPVE